MPQTVLINATLATLDGPEYGLVRHGSVVILEGRIVWAGAETDLPR